jgi:exodeoxyribonuclease X
MKYLILDVETAGMYSKLSLSEEELSKLGYKTKNEVKLVCEFSYVLYDDTLKLKEYGSTLCKPDVLVLPITMEINEITPEMLVHKESLEKTKEFKRFKEILNDEEVVLIGHNIPFDVEMLSAYDIDFSAIKQIDTLQLSKKYYLSLESHRLKYLFYYFKLYNEIDTYCNKNSLSSVKQHHNSLYDCIITYLLLNRIMKENKLLLEQLVALTEKSISYDVMPYGKYKGTKISELDTTFVLFFIKNKIDDKNLNATFKVEVEKRGGIKEMMNTLNFYQIERMLENEVAEPSINLDYVKSLQKVFDVMKNEQLFFKFGKHIGKHFKEVFEQDYHYIDFLFTNDKLNKYMKEMYENIKK